MNEGLNHSMNAGITIMAYRRQEPIASSVRYPKNLIDRKPERNVAEKPAITLSPLITMLLPVVLYVAITASLYDSPFSSSILYLHRN